MNTINACNMRCLMMVLLCSLLMATISNAQGLKEVKARVVDSSGQPVIGAGVYDATNKYKAVTDNTGSFSLWVPFDEIAVTTTFVGYLDQKNTLKAGATGQVIVLTAAATSLNEVIVVGYGTQKKVNLTGAVSVVNAKELENRPVTSVGNALQGTMAGVTVTAASTGQPGRDAAGINIRGIGTLNNSSAMILVDGVVSTMNNVNPDDIETISVLKDAASAAIYGSRAANGVILITTKKGKKGTSQVTYSNYVGKQKANGLPDFLHSDQVATLYNEALVNEGGSARYTDADIQKFRDGSDPYNYPNTDWLSLAYTGNGIQQNHYLSVSGGSDKSQYLFSLGYFDQNGLIPGTNTKRYTSRMNLSSTISDHLSVSGNLAFTFTPISEPQSSYASSFTQIIRQINRISPMIPYKYANGEYGYISDGSPMAWLNSSSFNIERYYDLVGNITADWSPVKDLHFKPSLFYVLKTTTTKQFIADIQYYDSLGNATIYQGPNSVTDGNSTSYTVTLQDLLEYGKSFGKHNFKILAGYSQEYTSYNYDQGYRKTLFNNLISDLNLGSTDGQSASGYSYELALKSYFGRLTYNYDGKYLLEANVRRDGSSRFAPGNKYSTFPSFSAGWNIDREDFFNPLKNVVSSLKLRGSWGKLGNQNIGSYYPYLALLSPGTNYNFGGTSASIAAGIAPQYGADSTISWETTTETDFGIDASLLNGALSFSADWFNKKTTGILITVPVGGVYGLYAPNQNAGVVQNRGWELTAGYHGNSGDLRYNATLNASFINNKVLDLYGTGPWINTVNSGGTTFTQVGYPMGSLYGYVAEGIFQSDAEVASHATQSNRTAAGDIKYKDLNGDNNIDGNDAQYLGNLFPKTTFGLNLNASYKGFDITVFLQGATNVKAYYDGGKLGTISNSTSKPTIAWLDVWTPENTGASMPRASYAYTQNQQTSSFWVKDGSYLRVKNLQLGYSIPKKFLGVIGIKSARIHYSGQNLWTITGLYKWVDPEAPNSSSIYYYPQVKVNSIGLNVTF